MKRTQPAIIVDSGKLRVICNELVQRYNRRSYPYNLKQSTLPQDRIHLPPDIDSGSLEHALFLFFLCLYMRGSDGSVASANRMSRLLMRRREFFDPAVAANISEESLAQSLREVELTFNLRFNPSYWIENAWRLNQWYDGDPRKIFVEAGDWRELFARLENKDRTGNNGTVLHRQGFCGFGPKIASMLCYYFKEADVLALPPFPIPVDFHIMRLMVANEVVRLRPDSTDGNFLSHRLVRTLQWSFVVYCQETGVDEIALANALWLASKVLCSQAPGNRSSVGKYAARRTEIVDYEPTWGARDLKAYAKSCGSCPLESTCQWNIPSSYYYVRGRIQRRPGGRLKPPATMTQLVMPLD